MEYEVTGRKSYSIILYLKINEFIQQVDHEKAIIILPVFSERS